MEEFVKNYIDLKEFVTGAALLFLSGAGWLFYICRNDIYLYIQRIKIEKLPSNQTVTFSIKHNEDLNSGAYYDAIKKVFLGNIEKYDLSKNVTHKDFSDVFLFKNKEEAENFRNSKDLDLILWGEFTDDRLMRNGVQESEFTLNVTYGFYHNENNKEAVSSDILARINKIVALKNKWKIRNTESLDDVKDVADSMFTLSLFTLGLSLANQGKISDAVYIFEKIFKYLHDKNDITLNLLRPYIKEGNFFLLVSESRKKNIDWSIICKLANNILLVDQLDLNAMIMASASLYKLGRFQESESIVQRMIQAYPRSGAARASFAFIYILKGGYDNALKHYKKLFLDSNVDFATVEIIDFLNIEYKRIKEPALRFASGAISYYLNNDYDLAAKDLKEFLDNADEASYGSMYKEAKKILEEVSNINS